MQLLKKDIKNYWHGVVIAITVLIVLDRIFGTCCPSRILFGLPCPACGTTRSLWAILSLDFKTALWYQPLMPFIIALFVLFCYKRYFKRNINVDFFQKYVIILIVIGIFLFCYRMINFYPDNPPLEYTENNIYNNIRGIYFYGT